MPLAPRLAGTTGIAVALIAARAKPMRPVNGEPLFVYRKSYGDAVRAHALGSFEEPMEEVEDADPGSSARVSWLDRLIGLDSNASPLQAFSVGGGVAPTSPAGPERFPLSRERR